MASNLLYGPIYQLKITLRDSKPPIWRRLQVREDMTLSNLHHTLQMAMGWTNSHLHQFVVGSACFGEPYPEADFDPIDERRVRLRQIVQRPKDKFIYEYDFGDGWTHEVVVEQFLPDESSVHYPRCLSGRRQCPPEDVGGFGGYAHFLQAIQDEAHPEHDEYLAWIGGPFDPDAFDVEAVNQALKRIR
jgi:hypothetical protein